MNNLMIKEIPEPVSSSALRKLEPNIRHGFFTRMGGVSTGIYQSLNIGLGTADARDNVIKNRARICRAFGVASDRLATVHQCHSADVAPATAAWPIDARPQADAVVTKTPGLVIGVLTADCGPVLFADSKAGVVGAAHAGWKGAMGGVVENTIDAMIKLGASRKNILAVLGPCISQKNYEVGNEYAAIFLKDDPANSRYFIPSQKEGRQMFDLEKYITDRLHKAGVEGEPVGLCTYDESDWYYSCRRSVHNHEPGYGCQISAIVVQE